MGDCKMNKFKIMLMIIILIFIGLVAYYKYLDNKNRVLMTSIPEIPINNVKKNENEDNYRHEQFKPLGA